MCSMTSPKFDTSLFGCDIDEYTSARVRAIRDARKQANHHGVSEQFMLNAWRTELASTYGIDVSRMTDNQIGQLWGKGAKHIIVTDHVNRRPVHTHCTNFLVFECTTYCIIRAINGWYELNGTSVKFDTSGAWGNFMIVARDHVRGQKYDSVIMFRP